LEAFRGGLKKSENIPIAPDPGNAGEGKMFPGALVKTKALFYRFITNV
jgi:hypothetical protein